ncbi:MAG: carboxypeptidase regulatory-like domain-containing protein [Planctomycetia bacterium]|nr:carboxypeptidase regulatory-like domain-containing protein [Planctomycetia bacterium]
MRNLVVAIGFVFLLGGCSGGGAKVTGKVTLDDGAAAPRGSVIYTSDAGSFRGGIESSGTYTIEGVPSGDYTVAVTGVMDSEQAGDGMNYDAQGNYVESAAPAPKSLIADKYSDPTKSGLKVTVPGTYDLKLEGAAGGGGAPAGGATDASS